MSDDTPHDENVQLATVDLVGGLVLPDRLQRLIAAISADEFIIDADSAMLIEDAANLVITDQSDYRRGYTLIDGIKAIEDDIKTHYARYDGPLGQLVKAVQARRLPQQKMLAPIKAALSKRLGTWKFEQDEADRRAAAVKQAADDAAAKAAQAARAATLERIAAAEPDPKLAESFRVDAAQVRAVDVQARPVEIAPTAPKITGTAVTTTWVCVFDDVKALMQAWVEGRCFLNPESIVNGTLQDDMDAQATSLTTNLGKAFPGCRAVASHAGTTRRPKRF